MCSSTSEEWKVLSELPSSERGCRAITKVGNSQSFGDRDEAMKVCGHHLDKSLT